MTKTGLGLCAVGVGWWIGHCIFKMLFPSLAGLGLVPNVFIGLCFICAGLLVSIYEGD